MAVQNSLRKNTGAQSKPSLSVYLSQNAIKNHINNVLGGANGQRFISSIISATITNPALQDCSNQSIVSAALLGESLKLSPSPQLGHYYLVPFNNKNTGGKVAQFQLGYKGYIQLAIRSGQYKKLNVLAIKKGELEYFDPLNEEIKINLRMDNWDERDSRPTIGYYAVFELVNGFKKAIYWSKKQMIAHAEKYSQAFGPAPARGQFPGRVSYTDFETGNFSKSDEWAYSSFWYKDFDGMAYKTMLRQLISKWGIMSIEMQTAFEGDMAYIHEDGTKEYVENDIDVIETTHADPAQPAAVNPAPAAELEHTAAPERQTAPVMDAQQALFGE